MNPQESDRLQSEPLPESTAPSIELGEDASIGDALSPLHQTVPPTESRLHVATLWVPAAETAVGAIVPTAIGSLFVGPIAPVVFLVVVAISAILNTVRYRTMRYQMVSGELIIRSGVLTKRERRIPWDRVQEIQIQQGVVHRFFRCAKLEISTAGSDTHEASLDVLTLADAESMKALIGSAHSSATPDSNVTESDSTPTDYRFELDFRTLLLGGVTSKVVAFVGAVGGTIGYFQFFGDAGTSLFGTLPGRVREQFRIPGPEVMDHFEAMVPDSGIAGFVADLWFNDNLGKSMLFAIGGVAVAVGAYIFRYYDFRLKRTGEALSMSHGLMTYRHGGLRRTRIQALKLEEGLLRRMAGLATVRVDSAGDHAEVDEKKNQDVLVPVVRRTHADDVAREVLPSLAGLSPPFLRVSRLAISRGCKKGAALVAVSMFLSFFAIGWYCLLGLLVLPVVYVINERRYHHTGYWLDNDYLVFRTGWLQRWTLCIPTQNVQSVALSQNFFDRRLNLATLQVDIAGQSNTGGGPEIRNLPLKEAEQMQTRLASKAAITDFNW